MGIRMLVAGEGKRLGRIVTLIRIKAGLGPTLMLPKVGNRQIDEQLAATDN